MVLPFVNLWFSLSSIKFLNKIAGTFSIPACQSRHPYVGIIQIRLWVEVKLPLSKKLPKYSVYLVSIVFLHNIVKSSAL